MSIATQIPGYRAGTWQLDPAHTEVGFVVRHMMVSKIRGRFNEFEGTIVTAEDPLQSSATASIDLSTISTGQQDRDNHLRSQDFFAVDEHPKMTFASTAIRADGEDITVDGDLSIRGVTRPVTLTVEVNGFGPDPYGGTRAGFSATGEVNRKDFGVNWNAAIEGGGVVVADKVQLVIEAEAVLAT